MKLSTAHRYIIVPIEESDVVEGDKVKRERKGVTLQRVRPSHGTLLLIIIMDKYCDASISWFLFKWCCLSACTHRGCYTALMGAIQPAMQWLDLKVR